MNIFLENPEFNLLSLLITLVLLIIGYYVSDEPETGWVLLCSYTLFHSHMLINICCQLMADEDLDINVVSASLLLQLLLYMVIAVRVYTQFAKHEFEIKYGFVSALVATPFIIIFYSVAFQIDTIGFIIILYIPFTLFLVIELYYIKNGDRIELHIDDPIRGVLILHIDLLLGVLILLALIFCGKTIRKCFEVNEDRRRRRQIF